MNSFQFENCYACIHPKKGIILGKLRKNVFKHSVEKKNQFESLMVVIESFKE